LTKKYWDFDVCLYFFEYIFGGVVYFVFIFVQSFFGFMLFFRFANKNMKAYNREHHFDLLYCKI